MDHSCIQCLNLAHSRRKICWGTKFNNTGIWNSEPEGMVCAESPGIEEDKFGEPLIGKSGKEGRHHLMINGIASRGVILDNICKCRASENGKDRPPTLQEIKSCTTKWLIPEIIRIKPRWIISMGRISTQFFLGNVDISDVHGIPRTIDFHGLSIIIIPTYHPAAGLHDPDKMLLFNMDMHVAGEVIRGKIAPHPPIDAFAGTEDYREIRDEDIENEPYLTELESADTVAIDTEFARNAPWCLSFSIKPGTSRVVMADQAKVIGLLNEKLSSPETLTICHNLIYDWPVLLKMGINIGKPACTMVMAYLLQTEPQGLKALAYRHCGMLMTDYSEMVGGATEQFAEEYVNIVAALDWPDPESKLEWKDGVPKVRKPQNIKKKALRILKKGKDFASSWKAIKDGTEEIEQAIGKLQEGELCDIPFQEALFYSGRDADSTVRIFPILWERICALGLEDTFWRDMRIMPMLIDMMRYGIAIDKSAFSALKGYFQVQVENIQDQIQKQVGHFFGSKQINPGSYPQMGKLLYDDLKLHEQGGRHKAKTRSKTDKPTSDDVLKRYLDLHPVVDNILEWRKYKNLCDKFLTPLPLMADTENRIHATFQLTRTSTGRLSCKSPNLMQMPTRTEEGKMVRDCFIASDGFVFLSGDFAGIEMRCAGGCAKDERMLKLVLEGKDIHKHTASDMFGIPVDEVDEMKHRYPAKRVGFGILNLISATGLQRELTISGVHFTVEECERMIKAWFNIYKGIAAYIKESGQMAKRYGYVRDMWGRVRYIPGIKSVNSWIRMEAERAAGNFPIQSGAQGIVKEAMGRLTPFYRSYGDALRPIIQIHDDLVWEVREDILDEVIPQIKSIMEGAAPAWFPMPLEVDFKAGRLWGSLKKYKLNKEK